MLLPTWVFVDARGRGVRRAALYAFLTVLSAVIGLVVYLIARPEDPRSLPCPGCGKDVDGGAYCPHCGRDLSAAFCASCRYPLKADWVYCPACRTEIKPPAAAGGGHGRDRRLGRWIRRPFAIARRVPRTGAAGHERFPRTAPAPACVP